MGSHTRAHMSKADGDLFRVRWVDSEGKTARIDGPYTTIGAARARRSALRNSARRGYGGARGLVGFIEKAVSTWAEIPDAPPSASRK